MFFQITFIYLKEINYKKLMFRLLLKILFVTPYN